MLKMDKKIIIIIVILVLVGLLFFKLNQEKLSIEDEDITERFCVLNKHIYDNGLCISETKECDAWDYFEGYCELD